MVSSSFAWLLRFSVSKTAMNAHLTLWRHVCHWVTFCYVVAISEMEPVLFFLGTNTEGLLRQKKIFAFCLLYTLFTFNNHIELDSPSMWQTHCIIFLPRTYSFHAPVVFSTKASAICFPILFHIKNIWRALKNTDPESIGLRRDWNSSSVKLHCWVSCLARCRNHCSQARVSEIPKTTPRFREPLGGLVGLRI